ncbi:MAG TPA: hypothetical protein VGV86_04695 [Acidimicrobiales bacterium]|nr:hypothetical protein [Acidimicrobiales bacterium]
MAENELIEQLAGLIDRDSLPNQVPVPELAPVSVDVLERRLRELVGVLGPLLGLLPRISLSRDEDRTVLTLPLVGARISGYHGSGAIEFKTAMGPMDNLIGRPREVDELRRMVESVADGLNVGSFVGSGEDLVFERLWQIKASGADREGRVADTVLCRAIGAFRHMVAGLPVWGPASVAVQVAGDAKLDSLRVYVRATTDRIIETASVVSPEEAARRVVRQLAGLIPENERAFADIATAKAFRFGYLSLTKHQRQPLLPPAYVAEIETGGEDPMSYLAVVPATEKEFLPLTRIGSPPSVLERREKAPLPV